MVPRGIIHAYYMKNQYLSFEHNIQLIQRNVIFFMFVDRASLYNLFQIKPTRCTLIRSIFISTSIHVSGYYVLIIRRTFCIYATLLFFVLYGFLSGLLVGMRTDSNPYRVKNTSVS